jgi:hypothetical protein
VIGVGKSKAQKGRVPWTDEEVKFLLEGVEKHDKGGNCTMCWINILKDPMIGVKFNPVRTSKDLRYKYINLLDNNVVYFSARI